MNINDLLISNHFITNFKQMNSENYISNILLIIAFAIYYNYDKIKNLNFTIFNKKFNSIKFEIDDTNITTRCQSIMHYMLMHTDVHHIKEYVIRDYWNRINSTGYKMDQNLIKINEHLFCEIYDANKNVISHGGMKDSIQIKIMYIKSYKLNIKEIQTFIDKCVKEYETYVKNMECKNKLLINISWNEKNNNYGSNLIINQVEWSSTVSFENKFFENKDEILCKIDKFINSKEKYKEKGIPHTLGILLWGDPGCGKTGFIKSLANYKSLFDKHIINIKLSKNFNVDNLHYIIFNEKIDGKTLIPFDKRIIIFEDIDCMCDIVNDRETNNTEKKVSEDNNNNNLSNLLNLFDGLMESSERIIIMTTNYPDKLDHALTRPGRMDIKICFKKASYIDIINMLKHYWDVDAIEINKNWSYLLSHADIINYCKMTDSLENTLKLIKNSLNKMCTPKKINNILKNYFDDHIDEINMFSIKIPLYKIGEICFDANNYIDAIAMINNYQH